MHIVSRFDRIEIIGWESIVGTKSSQRDLWTISLKHKVFGDWRDQIKFNSWILEEIRFSLFSRTYNIYLP